jgi:hypothetical protein
MGNFFLVRYNSYVNTQTSKGKTKKGKEKRKKKKKKKPTLQAAFFREHHHVQQFFNLSKKKLWMWPEESYGRRNGLKLLEVNHLIAMHINAPLCVHLCLCWIGKPGGRPYSVDVHGHTRYPPLHPTTRQVFP